MNINSPFPLDVDHLIDMLDNNYPDRCPSVTDSDREIWLKAGQRSVVTFLKAWRKASLEKHPAYVRNEETKDQQRGLSREARAGLHEQVFRGKGRRRPRKANRA